MQLFALIPSPLILNQIRSSLFVSMMANRASPIVSCLITDVRESSSMHARNILDCLCSTVLSLQQILGQSKSAWGPGPVRVRLVPSVWRRPLDTVFPLDQVVGSRHSPQHYSFWSVQWFWSVSCQLAYQPFAVLASRTCLFPHHPSLPNGGSIWIHCHLPNVSVSTPCSTGVGWATPPCLHNPNDL